jgi:hypothetical protein
MTALVVANSRSTLSMAAIGHRILIGAVLVAAIESLGVERVIICAARPLIFLSAQSIIAFLARPVGRTRVAATGRAVRDDDKPVRGDLLQEFSRECAVLKTAAVCIGHDGQSSIF